MADIKPKKSVLGRGLAALIEDADDHSSNSSMVSPNDAVVFPNEIPLELIEVNPFQPRNYFDEESLLELAQSIRQQGIIQPITVRKLEENRYQIISGERRFRASKLANLTNIPVYVRLADDQQMLEMGLIENIQREDLNPLEVALSYQRLLSECNLRQEDLGERVGKNRTSISNYLRLLKLPPDIQIAVRDNKISFGHARAIISIEQVDTQLFVFKKIISDDLSVRKTEELVRELTQPKSSKNLGSLNDTSNYHHEYKKLQEKLSNHFGTKVSVKANAQNEGEIKLPFYSIDDFNRILEIISII
jgi:ParB family transcriptional regulator, chromosome partitioning protein